MLNGGGVHPEKEIDMKLHTILTLATASLGALIAGTAGAQHSIKAGEPFPAIAFPNAETGELKSINDYRGQKVILQIFASW